MKIESALKEMTLDPDMLRNTRVVRPVDPQRLMIGLTEVIQSLQKLYVASLKRAPSLDMDEVWTKFARVGHDLTQMEKREQRALCVHPASAVRPEFVEAAIRHRDPCRRMLSLYGLVNAYFASWRDFPSPERMEVLILGLIGSQRTGVRFTDAWATNRFLFSEEAAKKVAAQVVQSRKGVGEVCREMYIEPTTALAARIGEEALRLAVRGIVTWPTTTPEVQVVRGLEWMYTELMDSHIQPGLFREAVGELVISPLPERYSGALDIVKRMVFDDPRLGDPRMPQSQANWRGVPAEARDLVLAWQARIYIDYFFNTLLPPRDENRHRAVFWLGFVGKIKDFQVAVCPDDAHALRNAPSEIKHFARMQGGNTSAFMMLFEGYAGQRYIIIEFSELGNAAYIYREEDFRRLGYTLRSIYFERALLRRQDLADARIHHRGEWEARAWTTLYELGILP